MGETIAVMLVHGIGTQTELEVDENTQRLRQALSDQVGDQAVVRIAYWGNALQNEQNILQSRLKTSKAPLDWAAFRGFIMGYVADAIAYQPTGHDQRAYDVVHSSVARTLADLAVEAGPTAPLVVIAHSLGAVITSNYMWDVQNDTRRALIPTAVRRFMRDTPLELGHTFAGFYTLGAPFPLWSLRFVDFGRPIAFPAPELAQHHPGLPTEWVNIYDRDDVLGYPLRPINAAYADVVSEDIEANIGRIYESWNPLSHIAYWRDDDVIERVIAGIARLAASA